MLRSERDVDGLLHAVDPPSGSPWRGAAHLDRVIVSTGFEAALEVLPVLFVAALAWRIAARSLRSLNAPMTGSEAPR